MLKVQNAARIEKEAKRLNMGFCSVSAKTDAGMDELKELLDNVATRVVEARAAAAGA
ncbi:MAG: hypothetical protein LBR79_02410 [Oscillospiraceae bacterium]|jgi:ribosome-binding protein aMBF1 (putative translation factor)|nr:hypothetical protein [Oscillospiraceae bacterium]